MLPKSSAVPAKNEMLSRFVDRFQQDGAFRSLAQRDAHAALQSVGIKVPNGINIQFADSAAAAVDRLLDQPPPAASATLDDTLLMHVTGGTGRTAHDDLQAFLDLFHLSR
jgi:hypothetical protein